MKKYILLISVLMAAATTVASSQSFFTREDHILNGFSGKVSGLDFEYHSCIPGLRASILVRATGGKDMMEWETSPVPEKIAEKYAAFVWVAAIGSSPGIARMDLETSQGDHLSFYTDGRKSWDIKGRQRIITELQGYHD